MPPKVPKPTQRLPKGIQKPGGEVGSCSSCLAFGGGKLTPEDLVTNVKTLSPAELQKVKNAIKNR